jgi:F-type H+-transporting ATPase subunit epsilon
VPTVLDIVSAERLLLSRAVSMVVIPAAEGELGVLERHAPMIVLLRGGEIRLYDGAQVTDRFFVAGGFAEITPDRCTILANDIAPVEDVSRSAAEKRINAAQAAWEETDKNDPASVDQALAALQSARAMLELAQAP